MSDSQPTTPNRTAEDHPRLDWGACLLRGLLASLFSAAMMLVVVVLLLFPRPSFLPGDDEPLKELLIIVVWAIAAGTVTLISGILVPVCSRSAGRGFWSTLIRVYLLALPALLGLFAVLYLFWTYWPPG